MPGTDQIGFRPQVCGALVPETATGREWLVTDGAGGYAAGTVSGLSTRRHHALWTVDGHVALAALDLTVTLPSGAIVVRVVTRIRTLSWECPPLLAGGLSV